MGKNGAAGEGLPRLKPAEFEMQILNGGQGAGDEVHREAIGAAEKRHPLQPQLRQGWVAREVDVHPEMRRVPRGRGRGRVFETESAENAGLDVHGHRLRVASPDDAVEVLEIFRRNDDLVDAVDESLDPVAVADAEVLHGRRSLQKLVQHAISPRQHAIHKTHLPQIGKLHLHVIKHVINYLVKE